MKNITAEEFFEQQFGNKITASESWVIRFAEDYKKLTTEPPTENGDSHLELGGVSRRIINSCFDCPFSYEYDLAVGYGCKVDPEERDIQQSKPFEPITPDWCPVKKESILVKYDC